MKRVPFYEIVATTFAVQTVLGRPPRLYLVGDVPQGVRMPYAVWQVVSGEPIGNLSEKPEGVRYAIQVDAFSADMDEALNVSSKIGEAVRDHAYATAVTAVEHDPEAKRFRVSFDIDWIVLS